MILSNQYRIAKPRVIALSPEYSWVVASRRTALDQALFNKAMEKFGGDLPFTNLFGRGVMRVVFPLANSMQYEIAQKLGKGGSLGEKGFDSVDWQTGEAVKIVPPHPDAPPPKPGSPPKTQRVKLGKALERLPDGLEKRHLMKWWSEYYEEVKNADFSVVISRHPVDVLRMSDHKEWNNCHSVGGGHFDSCVNEMKYGGLVAYLVHTKSLQTLLSPEQIAGKDEIFRDIDRGVTGVVPESRLRLRRYTNKEEGYDLAIPEMKVYGQRSSEFRTQVTDWSRKAQESVLGGKRPKIDEFTRRGGQYRDLGYDDAAWFNSFFRDTRDEGDTKYGVLGEESEELDGQLRALMEAAEHEYSAVLKNCRIEFDEFGHNEDGELTFTWSGQFTVILPESMIVDQESINDIERNLDELRDHLSKSSFFVKSNISLWQYNNGNLYFNFDIDDVATNGEGSPVQFRNFCSTVYHLYDVKFRGIERSVVQWLMENEFAHPSPARKFYTSNPQFENFSVKIYQGNLRATASESVGAFDTTLWREQDVREPVEIKIRDLVAEELNRIGSAGATKEGYNLSNFRIYLTAVGKQLILKLWFEADDVTTEKEMQEIGAFIGVVDRIFPRIVAECGKVVQDAYDKEQSFRDMLGNAF